MTSGYYTGDDNGRNHPDEGGYSSEAYKAHFESLHNTDHDDASTYDNQPDRLSQQQDRGGSGFFVCDGSGDTHRNSISQSHRSDTSCSCGVASLVSEFSEDGHSHISTMLAMKHHQQVDTVIRRSNHGHTHRQCHPVVGFAPKTPPSSSSQRRQRSNSLIQLMGETNAPLLVSPSESFHHVHSGGSQFLNMRTASQGSMDGLLGRVDSSQVELHSKNAPNALMLPSRQTQLDYHNSDIRRRQHAHTDDDADHESFLVNSELDDSDLDDSDLSGDDDDGDGSEFREYRGGAARSYIGTSEAARDEGSNSNAHDDSLREDKVGYASCCSSMDDESPGDIIYAGQYQSHPIQNGDPFKVPKYSRADPVGTKGSHDDQSRGIDPEELRQEPISRSIPSSDAGPDLLNYRIATSSTVMQYIVFNQTEESSVEHVLDDEDKDVTGNHTSRGTTTTARDPSYLKPSSRSMMMETHISSKESRSTRRAKNREELSDGRRSSGGGKSGWRACLNRSLSLHPLQSDELSES